MINNFLSFADQETIAQRYVRVKRDKVGILLKQGFSPICVDEMTNEYLFYFDDKLKAFMKGDAYANT